jgi:hypothetical protein
MAEAIETFQRGLAIDGNTELWAGLDMPMRCRETGLKRKRSLDHLHSLSAHSYVAPYNVAVVYAGLGENDAGIRLAQSCL